MARKPMPDPDEINLKRFWDKVVPMKDCLIWTAKIDQSGYGVFAVKGSLFSAHRISHTVYNEEVPPHLDILQICGNRACVRPTHLEMMTTKNKREKEKGAKTALLEMENGEYLPVFSVEPGLDNPYNHGPCHHCGCSGA